MSASQQEAENICLMSRFCRSVNEIYVLLGFYAALIVIHVSENCIGPICKGQHGHMKMWLRDCPEMSIANYLNCVKSQQSEDLKTTFVR